MARIEVLAPFILSWEGGFVNDPRDRGGATNKGVTISTWQRQGYDKNGDGLLDVSDLRLITDADAIKIMRLNFWNRWNADEIRDQSIANLLVDWVWGSGKYGITIPQRVLGVKDDGIVGILTIRAINSADPRELFERLWERRRKYLQEICVSRPDNRAFISGWVIRLNGIRYGSLQYNNNKVVKF